ncbi:hypothetical protein K443DRAFT_475416 [Laccaria amethystina LaAM-08-1]|uniref:Uncharacterized protein n=1 Tax=Laccaria amethystina LaAM-08-1 TaxID=1095629 RepID=A0A0C9WN55_9AGAR|nr:hypothetical protein K443DRAFT_475416 [Laccaria amethystina LaAM-08-1]
MVEACQRERRPRLLPNNHSDGHPRYKNFTADFSTLIATMPPPFMYINDADAIQTAIAVINNVFGHLSSTRTLKDQLRTRRCHRLFLRAASL